MRVLSPVLALLFVARKVSAVNVFAHFMVQNSFSYSQADWANDIATAKSIGIDGFALNIASATDYQVERLVGAYAAAQAAGFLLHFSFDMAGGSFNEDQIISLVAQYASSPSTYRWNNRVLISTFGGQNSGPDVWAAVKSKLSARGVASSFAPAFYPYRDPNQAQSMLSSYPAIDGFFNWWSWPPDTNTTLTTDTDIAYKNAIKSSRTGPYIMSVSPWQFKELGGDQNWVQQSDTLWNYRWLQAINTVKPDIVQIVTWNDYAESHYIGDINPNVELFDAANYVVGFSHAAWRIVGQYYISYFKNNSPPAITTDRVVYWYRVHPRATTCTRGTQPRMWNFPADAVFALAMLTSPANITIDIGSSHGTFVAGAGLTIGSVSFPAENNQTPSFRIVRGTTTVKSGTGPKQITTTCPYYNFNPIVGSI